MRAVVLNEHGGIEALSYTEDFPDPVPGEGQVVIRVRATSLNFHDVFTCQGMPGIKVPFPAIIGLDIAGEIIEIGPGVAGWSVGDRVLVNPLDLKRGLMGEVIHGGAAEKCLVNDTQLVPIPARVSFAQAASLPVAYGTAHRMMFTNGAVGEGDKVLILGASGGVGSCCVLLAKLVGAEVIACGSSPEKLAALERMGADRVINYAEQDFVKAIQEIYGKPHRRTRSGGVDVVVNFTGGDTWVRSFKCLRRGGKLLTCGATAGFDPKTDLRYVWTFELKILGSNSWTREDLETLMQLIHEGRLAPVIETVLPLQQTAEGVRMLRDREVIGKIIIEP
jgi:alcohol dehydrogenase